MFEHFIEAQDPVYESVLAQLRAGRKTTHWMWFIFPQLTALGRSPTAIKFGLDSVEDARAYLAHPLLGARLRQCTTMVNAITHKDIEEIFHDPDDRKFRSSMTLFAATGVDQALFQHALAKYYDSDPDGLTLAMI